MGSIFIHTTGKDSGKKNMIGLTEDEYNSITHRDYLKARSLGIEHDFYMFLIHLIPHKPVLIG